MWVEVIDDAKIGKAARLNNNKKRKGIATDVTLPLRCRRV